MTEIPNNDINPAEQQKLIETKQLVNKLFTEFNQNQSIHAAVKDIINPLHERIMQIALATPNLFIFDNHQVRIFLRSACHIAIAWNEIDADINPYVKKLTSIAEQIKQQQQYNSKEYIQFQHDLEKSLEKLKKRIAIKQKREAEKQVGQNKIAQAQQHTAKIIAEKIASSPNLPNYIQSVLREEWSNVLVLLDIRNGQESEIYQSKLSFIDVLLNIINQHESINAHIQDYKLLLNKYKKGLALIAFNHQEIRAKEIRLLQFLKKLNFTESAADVINPEELIQYAMQQNHTKQAEQAANSAEHLTEKTPEADNNQHHTQSPAVAQSNTQRQPEVQQANPTVMETAVVAEEKSAKPAIKPEASAAKTNTPAQSQSNQKEQAIETEQTHQKQPTKDSREVLSSLSQGTWVEITQADGTKVNAKLSWISPISGNHLFVDLHGLKLANFNQTDLIQAFNNKTIKIISSI